MFSKFSGLTLGVEWMIRPVGVFCRVWPNWPCWIWSTHQHRCNSISLEQKECCFQRWIWMMFFLDSNWRTWHDYLQTHIEFERVLFILVIYSYFSMIIDMIIIMIFSWDPYFTLNWLTLSTVHASSLEILLIFTFPTFSSWSPHGILPVVVPSGWSGAGSELSLGMRPAVHHFGRLSMCSIPSSKRKASESFTVETWKARSFGKWLEMMKDLRFGSKTLETNRCSLRLLA